MFATLLVVQLIVLEPAAGARARKAKPEVVVQAPEDVSASAHTREGEAARERGDHAAAARSYEAAYDAMPPAQRSRDAGTFVVHNAVRAYRDAFDATGSAGELDASRALLVRFEEQRKSAGASVPEFVAFERERIDRDLEKIATASAEPEPPPPQLTEPAALPVPVAPRPRPTRFEPTDLPPPIDERAVNLHQTGAALIGLSGFAIAAGAVLFGVGATLGPNASHDREVARHDARYLGATAEQRAQYDASVDHYVDGSRRVGRGFMIGGGSAMAVGVAGIVGGVVALVRARRRGHAALARVPFAIGAAR